MTSARLKFGVVALVVAGVMALATAGGATEITDPSSATVKVANGSDGKPLPFTVRATGFPAERAAYAHQCDGTTPADDP